MKSPPHRGAALAGTLYATVVALGALAVVLATVPAPSVPDQFWPQSVVTWFGIIGGVFATLRWLYHWWRRTQAPAVKAESDWRADITKRLGACEDSQKQQAETTAAIREMRETMASLKEVLRDNSRELRDSREEIARLQGAFAHWDGHTERRGSGVGRSHRVTDTE